MQVKSVASDSVDSKHLNLLHVIFKILPVGFNLKMQPYQVNMVAKRKVYLTSQFTEIGGDPSLYYGNAKAEVYFLNPSVLLSVIRAGIPRTSLPLAVDCYPLLASQDSFFRALDISRRTLHRYSTADSKGLLLSTNQGERVAQLVGMVELAREVLGTKDAAENWLNSPAVGLGGQRPMELMDTSAGAALVKTLLEQMKYGVYA